MNSHRALQYSTFSQVRESTGISFLLKTHTHNFQPQNFINCVTLRARETEFGVYLLSGCTLFCSSSSVGIPLKMAFSVSRAVWAQFSTSNRWSSSMTLPSSRSSQAGSRREQTTSLTASTTHTQPVRHVSWVQWQFRAETISFQFRTAGRTKRDIYRCHPRFWKIVRDLIEKFVSVNVMSHTNTQAHKSLLPEVSWRPCCSRPTLCAMVKALMWTLSARTWNRKTSLKQASNHV